MSLAENLTNMPEAELRRQFEKEGYIVVRGLLDPDEVERYKVELQRLSGLDDSRFDPDPERRESWTKPDGVTTEPTFWPLITDERLTSLVRALLGPNARYTQHSDLHVHHGDPGWHRDSADRVYGVGRDWDESRAPYAVARVAIYLQSFEQSRSKLGVMPGTHRREPRFAEKERAIMGTLSKLLPKQRRPLTSPFVTMRPKWIDTQPGDCVIFNQRLYHSSSITYGPKYSLFMSYGVENEHSVNHRRYYMFERQDLRYGDYPEPLAEELRRNDLYLPLGSG
ncbi:MAG: phytanoyl-CoA dioxygenase family protein [Thermoleophilaceae bacterium]